MQNHELLSLAKPALACTLVMAMSMAYAPARGAEHKPQIPRIVVEKYTLDNGLDVILHEDHTTPVVAVNVWYKVGSKDEMPRRTGFAHLFEHLMFQGSKNHDTKFFTPLEKIGAQLDGSTNTDRTNYYETVPSNYLEQTLWLEADRMGFLPPALTQGKLDNQRDVVKNERRQRVDNVPYGHSSEKLLEVLYPPGHPYHHSTLGSMADLTAASLEDVSNFLRTYYNAGNASLVIVGDFAPQEARRLVSRYFGSLPKGPALVRPKVDVPTLTEPKHITTTDRVTLPRAHLAWPTVPRAHPDEKALNVLAMILGRLDKENRLYRALMHSNQLATEASTISTNLELSGTFEVILTAQPGQSLDTLVKAADAEITRLRDEGPSISEVRKSQNSVESGLVMGLQAVERMADFLNACNVQLGDPLGFQREMEALFRVTPEDVKRVAKQYLTANRVRLDVLPGQPAESPSSPKAEYAAKAPPAEQKIALVKDDFDRAKMPGPAELARFVPPPFVRRTLKGGLEVLIAERHGLPILTLGMLVKSGESSTPNGKEGLASLTAALLTEGTTHRDALTLAGEIAEIGASFGANAGLESSAVFITALTKHQSKALELLADVLLNPAFPQEAIDRLKGQRLTDLARKSDGAVGIASEVFPKLLYGFEHPYGRPISGTPTSVKELSRSDIDAFFAKSYRPANATLIVAGDVKPDEIMMEVDAALARWQPGVRPSGIVPERPTTAQHGLYLVDKPGAAQSVINIGEVGVPRTSPDFFPLTLFNAVLGGQFTSRLNLKLREEKGYTYAARSEFGFRLGPGPVLASASVQTAVTKEAVMETLKEITEITGDRPVTEIELEFAKARMIKGFPSSFQTTMGVAEALAEIAIYDLPGDYLSIYQANLEAVTAADIERVSRKVLHPAALTILVVGDRSQVESGLRSLPFGKELQLLDPEGRRRQPTASSPTTGAKP